MRLSEPYALIPKRERIFMDDLLKLPEEIFRRSVNIKYDGKMLVLIKCDSLHQYLDESEDIIREVRRKRPVWKYINDSLLREDWVRFQIENLVVGEFGGRFRLRKDAYLKFNNWHLLSQDDDELPAYIDLSEDSLRDITSKFHSIKSRPNDVTNVVLSGVRKQSSGEKLAEIYNFLSPSVALRTGHH
jgi:hypothetical protein